MPRQAKGSTGWGKKKAHLVSREEVEGYVTRRLDLRDQVIRDETESRVARQVRRLEQIEKRVTLDGLLLDELVERIRELETPAWRKLWRWIRSWARLNGGAS